MVLDTQPSIPLKDHLADLPDERRRSFFGANLDDAFARMGDPIAA